MNISYHDASINGHARIIRATWDDENYRDDRFGDEIQPPNDIAN